MFPFLSTTPIPNWITDTQKNTKATKMQVQATPLNISSSRTTLFNPITLIPSLSYLSISGGGGWGQGRPPSTVIRMGGGPRTFPGGVSKWQWKRMQAKKAKQLLKARLARERHIYEMRKRAELMAAVSDLERPWELVNKVHPVVASSLFSVPADEQLQVLADRFQKPGGFDMWTEDDGPQIFVTPDEGLPTARFFPKGVVHSIRPYERNNGNAGDESSDFVGPKSDNWTGPMKGKNGHRKRIGSASSDDKEMLSNDGNSRISIPKQSSNGVNRSGWSGGVSRMDGDQDRFNSNFENDRKSMDLRQGRRDSYKTRRDIGRGSGQLQGNRIGSTSGDDEKMESNDRYSQFSTSKQYSNGVSRSNRRGDDKWSGGVSRMDGDRNSLNSKFESDGKSMDSRRGRRDWEGGNKTFKSRSDGSKWSRRGQSLERSTHLNSEDIYDMSMQGDGSYGFSGSDRDGRISSQAYDQKMTKSNFSD